MLFSPKEAFFVHCLINKGRKNEKTDFAIAFFVKKEHKREGGGAEICNYDRKYAVFEKLLDEKAKLYYNLYIFLKK